MTLQALHLILATHNKAPQNKNHRAPILQTPDFAENFKPMVLLTPSDDVTSHAPNCKDSQESDTK